MHLRPTAEARATPTACATGDGDAAEQRNGACDASDRFADARPRRCEARPRGRPAPAPRASERSRRADGARTGHVAASLATVGPAERAASARTSAASRTDGRGWRGAGDVFVRPARADVLLRNVRTQARRRRQQRVAHIVAAARRETSASSGTPKPFLAPRFTASGTRSSNASRRIALVVRPRSL